MNRLKHVWHKCIRKLQKWLQNIFHTSVIDRYMCEIQLNSVRVIAASIICLGFLLFLLPEDWDQCLPHLRSMLYNRDQSQECARDKHLETLHIRPREVRNGNSSTTWTLCCVIHAKLRMATTFVKQFANAHQREELSWGMNRSYWLDLCVRAMLPWHHAISRWYVLYRLYLM